MKFWHILFGLGLSIIITVTAIIGESQKISNKKFSDPFPQEQLFDAEVYESDQAFEHFFTKSGGFIGIFENSRLTTKENTFRLENGMVFLAGGLLERPQKEFLAIQNIRLNIEGRPLFAARDPNGRFVEVFTFYQPVDVWHEEDIIFTVPPQSRAKIPERTINVEELARESNSYSKQKIRWELSDWDTHIKKRNLNETYTFYENWKKSFHEYAERFPRRWSSGLAKSFFENVVDFTQYMQANFSIFTPERRQNFLQMGLFLQPFVEGQEYIEIGEFDNAAAFFSDFQRNISRERWQKIFAENFDIREKWHYFQIAQRIWLKNLDFDQSRSLYTNLWSNGEISARSIFSYGESILNEQVSKITFALERGEKKLAATEFLAIKDRIRLGKGNAVKIKDKQAFSRGRRVLADMILKNSSLQTDAIILIYDEIITYELLQYEDYEQEEIRLEIAYEIWQIIDYFIRNQATEVTANTLFTRWKSLNVLEIEQKRGEEYFSSDQKEFVKFIILAIGNPLTDEAIGQIKEAEAFEKQIEKQLEEILGREEVIEEVNTPSENLINNARQLLQFFLEQGISIDITKFRTNPEIRTSSFENAKYIGERLSGSFNYESQRFSLEFVRGEVYEGIPRSLLPQILSKIEQVRTEEQALAEERQQEIEEQAAKEAELNEFIKVETDILQNTSTAILSRRLAQKIFSEYGLDVQRQNIYVIDESLEKFEVVLAKYGGMFSIRFSFDQNTKLFRDVKGKYLPGTNVPAELKNQSQGDKEPVAVKIYIEGEHQWTDLKEIIQERTSQIDQGEIANVDSENGRISSAPESLEENLDIFLQEPLEDIERRSIEANIVAPEETLEIEIPTDPISEPSEPVDPPSTNENSAPESEVEPDASGREKNTDSASSDNASPDPLLPASDDASSSE